MDHIGYDKARFEAIAAVLYARKLSIRHRRSSGAAPLTGVERGRARPRKETPWFSAAALYKALERHRRPAGTDLLGARFPISSS